MSKRTEVVSIRFLPAEFQQIADAAARQGITVSEFIRRSFQRKDARLSNAISTGGVNISAGAALRIVGTDDAPLWQALVRNRWNFDHEVTVCCDGHTAVDDAIDHALFKLRDVLRAQMAALPEDSHGYAVLTA